MNSFFKETAHRPWDFPSHSHAMWMTWSDLLFAHWPVPEEALRKHIPAALEIDKYDGQSWIGIVPFRMSDVHLRRAPVFPPSFRSFPELNVRTYVTDGRKPGVWFFSLDAANRLAVEIARRWYCLPYFMSQMTIQIHEQEVNYESRRWHLGAPTADFRATYWPISPVFKAQPGTLEFWLTERYCLYSSDKSGRARRGEIHHNPWPLQMAEAKFEVNTMTRPLGFDLPDTPPLLHYAKKLVVAAWSTERVTRAGSHPSA